MLLALHSLSLAMTPVAAILRHLQARSSTGRLLLPRTRESDSAAWVSRRIRSRRVIRRVWSQEGEQESQDQVGEQEGVKESQEPGG